MKFINPLLLAFILCVIFQFALISTETKNCGSGSSGSSGSSGKGCEPPLRDRQRILIIDQ
ncbi:hypothetical protein PGB90_009696 [Kerria lacca]